jgi:hypothetical protein
MLNSGTAGIAAIDGGVGLEEVVVRAGIDVALGSGNDADRDAAAEPEGIADRHHPIAHPHLRRIPEGHRLERLLRLDLEQSQVGLGVVAQDLHDLELGAVGEIDDDLVGTLDHVIVGDDEA